MVAAIRSDAGVAEQCAFRSCGDRLRNPDDDMVLEAAVNGRADAIVTFNHRVLRQAQKNFKAYHPEQVSELWSEHHEEVQFRATTSTFLNRC